MKLSEYASYDALGLAELVAKSRCRRKNWPQTAATAIDAINPAVNAVVETYPDRIEDLDERTLGTGPFRGVPFLMKDVFGHEAGRRIEFGSRLCRGMVALQDTHLCELFKASGLNVLGRSAAPEYSMAGTTEGALYGNTSTPWKQGYSAGGSTGGGMAAVIAGIVPIAHGSDIAGSVRIPASFCGGVGLKPSRGRVSFGPMMDENGYGLGQNFVQAKSVRDAAAMLDCLAVPQTGDPFPIPRPSESYAKLTRRAAAWAADRLVDEGADGRRDRKGGCGAVENTATLLAEMGHHVSEESPELDGLAAMRAMTDVWFFGFDLRLEGYAKRSGQTIGPDTLEPVILKIYEYAKQMTAGQFLNALGGAQHVAPAARPLLRQVRRLAVSNHSECCRTLGHLQPRTDGRDDGGSGGEDIPRSVSVHAAAQRHGHAGDFSTAGDALDRSADRRSGGRETGERAHRPAARVRAGGSKTMGRARARASRQEIVDVGVGGDDARLDGFGREILLQIGNHDPFGRLLVQRLEQRASGHVPAFLPLFAGGLFVQRDERHEVVAIHELEPAGSERRIVAAMMADLVEDRAAREDRARAAASRGRAP